MPLSPLLLQEFKLLKSLPRDQLEHLGESMTLRELSRREVVFNRGDVGQVLCFLLEGRLQGVDFTVDGREVGLYFVDPGDYFGELAVIDGKPHAEFVIAVTKARIALLPSPLVRDLIIKAPEIASHLLVRLATRLREVSAQRTVLSLPNPAQRVCAQLAQLAVVAEDGSVAISHAPTHQEIAIMINTSRETVTRIFQVLQTKGILQRDGNALLVMDVAYLEAVAQGKVDPPKAG